LIRIIEEYDLAKYVQPIALLPQLSHHNHNHNHTNNHSTHEKKPEHKPASTQTVTENFNGFSPVNYPYTLRTVYMNNGSYFIVAKEGDTFYDIAIDVQLGVGELRSYNDVSDRRYEPYAGEMVYLQRKKSYAATAQHTLQPDETLRSVAQKYGFRLRSIYKLNGIDKSEKVEAGRQLKLRK